MKELFKHENHKNEISKILLTILPEKAERIYKELGDYYSLGVLLEKYVGKLKRLRLEEVFYD